MKGRHRVQETVWMQAGRLDADAAYGVGTVTNGSRWSSAVDRQTGATGADMGDAALLSYGRGLEQAHPSTYSLIGRQCTGMFSVSISLEPGLDLPRTFLINADYGQFTLQSKIFRLL